MDCAAVYFSVCKIETIGDSYMAAGGLFQSADKESSDAVCRTVDMAFAMYVLATVLIWPLLCTFLRVCVLVCTVDCAGVGARACMVSFSRWLGPRSRCLSFF